MKTHCLLIIACLSLGSLEALAQDSASTVAESYARGIGDVISAAGQYNVATSQANVNNQTATSMLIDNRMKWTNTYFGMRRINSDARLAEAGPRATTEDWIRMSKMMQPKRLNSVALDPINGHITWPPALTLEDFAAYRKPIEQFYIDRAQTGTVAEYPSLLQFEAVVNSLTAELKKHILDIPTKDYLIARNFVESFGYEARFASN